MTAKELLQALSEKGVKLQVKGDKLVCGAPEGVLTPQIQAQLRQYKAELLEILRNSPSTMLETSEIVPSKPFPLSYGQKALWFLYQLAPDSVAYNIFATLEIHFAVDRETLNRTWETLLNHHPILRTTYTARDSQPVQQVRPDLKLNIRQIDASAWSEAELNERMMAEADRPFDLEAAVLRVCWYRQSPQKNILLLVIHHIAGDWRSLDLLFSEFGNAYKEIAEKGTKKSGKIPLSAYSDYIHWQNQLLASSQGERLWNYWQQKLRGELPVLNLSGDRLRPPVQTYSGTTHILRLDRQLSQQLKDLARSEGTTPYSTLLATFQVLLYRYTGQEDILVGTPTSGRSRTEFEGMVGYFVNPVVVRGNVSGNPTFKAFLTRTRRTVLEAMEHQDYPFPLLVERLQVNRDPSYSPIFQIAFTWDPSPRRQIEESSGSPQIDKEIELLEIGQRGAAYDLNVGVANEGDSLIIAWEYNTDLFETETIVRMAGHFQTLLESVVANPQTQVSQLPMLTERERHQLLVEWNETAAEYPQDKCIHQLFERQVERSPDAVAVVFEDRKLSYRELNARANQVAHYLQKLGVKPESLVGICVERSIEMVVGLLGILKAGGAYVPLDPTYPQERLVYMLADANVQVLLKQKNSREGLSASKIQEVDLDGDWEAIARENAENNNNTCLPTNLAYVLYTSGSTGKPKGVEIEHRSVVAFLTWAPEIFTAEQLAGVLASTSICFDLSVFELFLPLCCGGKVILAKNALGLPNLQAASEVTLVNAVPSAIAELLRINGVPPSVRTINLAGEPLTNQLVEKIYQTGTIERVFNLYGPSEDTTYSTFTVVEKGTRKSSSIGRAIANTQVYILDSYLQVVPIGVPGELHIGGAGLARGYLNRPQLTKQKFIPNPFSDRPGDRLYKTGDLVRYLPDGNIEFIGRIDNQVKIRGFRIELGEIEVSLAQHPQVNEVVAISREDIPGDKRLVAYVVCHPEKPTVNELRDFLKTKLPEFMVPNAFVLLETMPRTPNGKVNRRALPAPEGLRPELEATYVMPETELEKRIEAVWKDVLKLDKVGIYDNFFDLGGHSLLVVQVRSQLLDIVERELSLVELFKYPTIGTLARYLSQQQTAPVSELSDEGDRIEKRSQLQASRKQQRQRRKQSR